MRSFLKTIYQALVKIKKYFNRKKAWIQKIEEVPYHELREARDRLATWELDQQIKRDLYRHH